MSGVRQAIAVAQHQFAAPNQRGNETLVSVGSKVLNESKDRKKDILLFVL